MSAFSSAFSSAFVKQSAQGFICPVMAQALLTDGAAWHLGPSGLVVGDRVLIGPAGKVYSFLSETTAARWCESMAVRGRREREIVDSINPIAAAAWKAKKRANLEGVAGRVVALAAKQKNPEKQAAMIEEANFCLAKWG